MKAQGNKGARRFDPMLPPFFVVEAERHDVQGLVSLLASQVPHVSVNTVWQTPWNWSDYYVIRDSDGRVIASGSLQLHKEGKAEIRGIAVHDDYRGRGLATLIIKKLIHVGTQNGFDINCVTRCPQYFARFGFKETVHGWLDMKSRQVARTSRTLVPCDEMSPRVTMMLMADSVIQ